MPEPAAARARRGGGVRRLPCTRWRWARPGAAALAVLAVAGCARVPRGGDTPDQLADALVRTLPIGAVLDAAAARDPRWPLEDKARLVSAAQLACMRRALSSAEVTPRQRQAAREHARQHPELLADGLQVLEGGAARLIGEGMLAGAGLAPPPAPASARESAALTALATEPRLEPLRRATGLDQLLGARTAPPAERASRGRAFGQRALENLMTDAFLRCHIPVKLLY